MSKPELLMLDEPTSGMGIEESKAVMNIIRRGRDMGVTVVVVSHDMSLITEISDWITVLILEIRLVKAALSKFSKIREYWRHTLKRRIVS